MGTILSFGGAQDIVPLANSGKKTRRKAERIYPPALAQQQLLFSGVTLTDTPPWLIEDAPLLDAPKKAEKKAPLKTARTSRKAPAKKTNPGQKGAVQKKTAAKRPKAKAVAQKAHAAPLKIEALPISAQPIPRSSAPVVWRKEGPLDAVRFWLRSAGRNALTLFARSKPARQNSEVYGAKLRTRKELLTELSVLRQENMVLRTKLGLPAMAFGRQVADTL